MAPVARPVVLVRLLPVAMLVVVALGLTSTAGAEPVPTMSISPSTVTPGQEVTVSVAGWPAGTADVAVCGGQLSGGIRSCNRKGGSSIAVGPEGSGSTVLTFDASVGCPCVVEIAARDGRLVQSLPIEQAATATSNPSIVTAHANGDDTVKAQSWSHRTWVIVLVAGLVVLVGLTVAATGWRPGARRREAGRDAFVLSGDDEVAGR